MLPHTRIEVVEISYEVSCGVAKFAVGLVNLLDDIVANADVRGIVNRRDPQAKNLKMRSTFISRRSKTCEHPVQSTT